MESTQEFHDALDSPPEVGDLTEKMEDLEVELEGEDNNSCSDLPHVEKDLVLANEAKEKGNNYFRAKNYDEAISSYSTAVSLCPTDEEHKENLSVFLGNRAAAYFSVDEHDCVIDDCTASLELNPSYVKVLMRRSQAYEKLTKPEDALVDAKKVQELDPQYPKINTTVKRLEIECEERMVKMKDEALGKLKELGNSFLGNFGMSLDNFNMKQDEKTGSWNISMGNK